MTLRGAEQMAQTRYRVVRDGLWYRVRIGTSNAFATGRYLTKLGAEQQAWELCRAFLDGAFVSNLDGDFVSPPSTTGAP
jgi:hypothetical protein